MKLLDIMTTPWAITSPVFAQIIDIYNAHIRGPKLDFQAVEQRLQEARAGRPMGRTRREMIGQISNGVAVLDLEGPLAKRMSSVSAACEGTSTNLIADFFQQAVEDPEVKGIVLNIDSPGGTVDGTMDLARAVFAARGKKPILALADGMACSAAYWIGAAADAFFISNETTMVGSIGVVFTHVDYSKALEKQGIVVTEVCAGKYKRAISAYKPLSEEGKAFMQDMADDIYTLFVNDISSFRNVPVEQVLEHMAEGRVFMGEKAIEAGLVDGVSTLDALMGHITQGHTWTKAGAGAAHSTATTSQEESMKITREQLAADQPDLLETLLAEGRAEGATQAREEAKAEKDTAVAEATTAATVAETTRIKGVFDAALSGHEALVQTLAFDGKTQPGEAALQINQAEKAKGNARLAEIRTERSNHAAFGGDPVGDAAASTADDLRARWDASAHLRNLYGSFEAFQKAHEKAEAAAASGRIIQKGK